MALGVGDGPGYVGYGVGDGNGAAGIGGSGKFFACRPSISSADITISFFSWFLKFSKTTSFFQ